MYKPITDLTKCPTTDENNEKSIICSQVEAGKIPADQLQCCFDGHCISDLSGCLDYGEKLVAKCHNITTLDACRRTDPLARRVCDWQGGLFCVSVRSSTNSSDYQLLPEAVNWIVNRNKIEESYNGMFACYNETIGDYELCNSPGTDANFNCTDLFEDGCYSCDWRRGITNAIAPRRIKGELCEIKPTATITATITITETSDHDKELAIGFGSVSLVIVLIIIITFLARKFCQ